ncbi:MAG: tetratricopeptide repeat protein [Candidatus Hydrogenedentes bacterium]|nr:tetratricopeptide repeat protein [Candidatus Hydrogenedentota bacterium]
MNVQRNSKPPLLAAAVVFVAAVLFFSPVLTAGFLNWDDPFHLLTNENVQSLSLANLRAIFTTTLEGAYMPVTVLSYAIEYAMAGYSPWIYHATNLLLHAVTSVLVLFLGLRLRLPLMGALIAALVFALHPIHVESVAWISDRKGMLSTCFATASLLAYAGFAEERKKQQYTLTGVFLMLALLSKPIAVPIPATYLVIDWLMKRPWSRRMLLEKAPFLALAGVIAVVTVLAEGAEGGMELAPNAETPPRLLWFWCVAWYPIKFFLPFKLSPLYVMPPPGEHYLSAPLLWLSPVFIGALLLAAFAASNKTRWPLFGVAFYVLTIAPVARFVPLGAMLVADRYMYLPSLGFCLMLGAGVLALRALPLPTKALTAATAVLLILVGAAGFRQAMFWHDSTTLWTRVVDVSTYPSKNVALAYLNLGTSYHLAGKWNPAIDAYERGLEIEPEDMRLRRARGYARAQAHIPTIFGEENPAQRNDPEALMKLADSLMVSGAMQDAYDTYEQVLGIEPRHAEAHYRLGIMLSRAGFKDRAREHLAAAVEAAPNHVQALTALGIRELDMGNFEESVKLLERAAAANPDYAPAKEALAKAQGRLSASTSP